MEKQVEEEIRAASGVVPLNRSLSAQRLPQQYQQAAAGLPMAGRPPNASGVPTQHYNPQQFTPASTMMMAQQQQRPQQQQQQQQQRPPVTATAAGTQLRGGSYLQQAQQQYPPAQYVHHMTSVPMSNMSAARPGVAPGAAYGNMQSLASAQHHNMQARQKPNQVQTPGTQYIGGVAAGQQQALRQGPGSIASQQQQQQALQQQQVAQMNAQRLAPHQQQAMARQTQTQQQQMLQNQGNMRVVSAGGQVWQQGKPTAQYQQQTQQQPQQQQPPQQQQQPSPQQQQQPSPRPPVAATAQARPATPQVTNPAPAEDTTGSILGKRSIQDLLAQIDPRERLDPDVEEVFLEIADDFIENVASFSCKIAQHRKSKVLEAKDVLLHLDKAYNITVPGFGGDEYRSYKRPSVSETHKQRLAVVRKSAAAGQETKVAAANVSTPVKAVGIIGAGTSPTPSLGMPRIPRV